MKTPKRTLLGVGGVVGGGDGEGEAVCVGLGVGVGVGALGCAQPTAVSNRMPEISRTNVLFQFKCTPPWDSTILTLAEAILSFSRASVFLAIPPFRLKK
jgi:hypothetical protein